MTLNTGAAYATPVHLARDRLVDICTALDTQAAALKGDAVET